MPLPVTRHAPNPSTPSAGTSDHQLMAQIAHGDEKAFRSLVERHQGPVIGTISKMLGNSTDSEDLAQQTFLRIWKHAGRYKPKEKFTTYLYTIVRNLVFNESRRRARKPSAATTTLRETNPSPHTNPGDQPDSQLLKAELQNTIARAISELPEKQRLALVLRRYEDLTYEEIATILKTTVPSVKSLLFRARQTLRISLQNYI